MTAPRSILVPGDTCWRMAHAERVALIRDGADYFRSLKQAILSARHSVLMVGWDFHTGIELERGAVDIDNTPNRLGEFLSSVVRHNPKLHVHVLRWDLAFLKMPVRGTNPLLLLSWKMSRRIHFKLDGNHPAGACHHQKIVVIDDQLAFCGGIDSTVGRWDTADHLDDDPRRDEPDGRRYGPWHDVTMAVDGDAARALGDLARMRWEAATGETITPPPRDAVVAWPKSLEPDMRDVAVGIARTWPKTKQMAETREIEALYLAAIASAQRSIYLVSQYFASPKIASALGDRLAEANGPEVIIINPIRADGWLEETAMGSARALLLRDLRTLDHHQRLRVATPITVGGEDIYVHAKILVIDNQLLRVGSSNINNRSMGLDTECDLIIEAITAGTDRPDVRKAITAIRDRLIAELLGVPVEQWCAVVGDFGGSLIAALDQFTKRDDRRLVPFVPPAINAVEAQIAVSGALDPTSPEAMAPNFVRGLRLIGRPRPRHWLNRLTRRSKTA